MAFGSPSGRGGRPHPCIFHRVRPPHLPTPDAAPPCRSPVHAKTASSPYVSLSLAVTLLPPCLAVAAPPHPGDERRRRCSSPSRRRALPSPVLPIQAHPSETASPPRRAAFVQAPPPWRPSSRPQPAAAAAVSGPPRNETSRSTLTPPRPAPPLGPLPPSAPPRLPRCLDIAAVFRKSLRLTNDSRRKFASGRITNLISTDAESLQEVVECRESQVPPLTLRRKVPPGCKVFLEASIPISIPVWEVSTSSLALLLLQHVKISSSEAVREGAHEAGHAEAGRDIQAAGSRTAPAVPAPEATDGRRGERGSSNNARGAHPVRPRGREARGAERRRIEQVVGRLRLPGGGAGEEAGRRRSPASRPPGERARADAVPRVLRDEQAGVEEGGVVERGLHDERLVVVDGVRRQPRPPGRRPASSVADRVRGGQSWGCCW